jgi:hypothetical protein
LAARDGSEYVSDHPHRVTARNVGADLPEDGLRAEPLEVLHQQLASSADIHRAQEEDEDGYGGEFRRPDFFSL